MALDDLRKQIDELDVELQRLFERRMALCDEVALEKKNTNASVLQSGREEDILKRAAERSEGFADSSVEFFKNIMAISRGRQNKLLASDITLHQGGEVNVIIPCGGVSSRMGFDKLVYELEGEAVIIRVIRAFADIDNVSRIIIPVCKEQRESIEKTVKAENFTAEIVFAEGGETRQQSVKNAAKMLSDKCEWICIHDGARPLISREVIEKCIEDAKDTGAAVVCVPVKDTIKEAKDGFCICTPDRSELFAAQTPQVIARAIYERAIDRAEQLGAEYTDDVSLCEAIGIRPKITLGDYANIKLTTPEDIEIARQYIKGRCGK